MKKTIPFLIVLIFIIPAFYFSYQKKVDPNAYVSYTALLIIPFDTAKVLTMMNIVDSVNEFEKYRGEKNGALFPKVGTLDLIWRGPITDCPEWRYADSTGENYPIGKDFYIEPANEKLNLPDHVMRTRIQFIGREYGGISFPKDFAPYTSSPHAGRVFKYYAYKIYKPFKVYGPNLNTEIDDGVYPMTELIAK